MDNQLVADIRSWVLFPHKEGKHTYLVGSTELDKYLVVPAIQYPVVVQILDKLRFNCHPEQIEADLKRQNITTDVNGFCHLLASKGLLVSPAPRNEEPDDNAKKRWPDLFGHLRALTWDVASISLEGMHRVMDRFATWYLGMFIFWAVVSSGLVLVSGDFTIFTARQSIREAVYQQNIIWIMVVNLFVIPFFVFFHEMGHAAAAVLGKVYPRRLSFRLFLTVPYFSIQLPGLYTLPARQRYGAILAGPLVDFTLGNITFLLVRFLPPLLVPWFLLAALANYSRFLFNILPILPMTDGYALMSQALFHEIDIRGHAGREFKRWRQKRPNNFKGRYLFFYLINSGIALFIIVSALWQLDVLLFTRLIDAWWFPMPAWTLFVLTAAIDVLCLYLIRKRLKVLLAW